MTMIRLTWENRPPGNAQLEHGVHLHNNCLALRRTLQHMPCAVPESRA
jgi:hypothetical protein